MSKKKIIETYYDPIYQIYLVVANKYVELKDLQKKYIHIDGKEIDERILDALASTWVCKDKKTGIVCILVKYNKDNDRPDIDKKADFINTISHEATHVALDIYDSIGQSVCFCTLEPFCYLQGWAAECIYKTLTK